MDPNVGQADAAAMKKVDAEGNHRKFTKFFFIGFSLTIMIIVVVN